MKLFDCTLRDGGNVLGNGFPKELTECMLRGMTRGNIPIIEMGNAHGIGAFDGGFAAPLTDEEYLDLAQPFLDRAEIGMFLDIYNFREPASFRKYVDLAAERGLHFLRVGANAGSAARAFDAVEYVRSKSLTCYFSLMKGYVLPPDALAAEAAEIEKHGAQGVTIMDSAGTMFPEDVTAYVLALRSRVSVPVGFHGHNNLGLSVANAMAAQKAGAEFIDCGLLRMARSAGNLPTEMAAAVFRRMGLCGEINFFGLLSSLQEELIPAMWDHGYSPAVGTVDLVYGLSGCHSSNGKMLREVAETKGVDLLKLIVEVSSADRTAPTRALAERMADRLLRDAV